MGEETSEQSDNDQLQRSAATFTPKDYTSPHNHTFLPDDELWMTILESPCTFPPDIFTEVMLNMIKNPNVTSSHLFRADIFYDTESDGPLESEGGLSTANGLQKNLKQEYQPLPYEIPGFHHTRTIVRQLVPRNPQLDKPLLQTCHFFHRLDDGDEEQTVVIYIPHVHSAEEMPFYHPTVSRLAFEHRFTTSSGRGHISLSYSLFPGTSLNSTLQRTALRLLQTLHKHGQGQLAGYQKRVHLDQVIPQKRYQDTYTRLKAKYGKWLAERWVEVTDPGKHVFEDIGIAAFCIELWRDMYVSPEAELGSRGDAVQFPGFVDIGCGNGVLVYILLSEGYEGWGFDARERKTWSIFPEDVQGRLRRSLLVPQIFASSADRDPEGAEHHWIFKPGTFIISNHADELTAWTPLLAYLNNSSFIAIPCCSHDLAGSRFRAPISRKGSTSKQEIARLPQQSENADGGSEAKASQAAETGSLKLTEAQKKMPSAYSTLCSYVASLADEVGFEPEKEVLRIPSTRNQCIIGRRRLEESAERDDEARTRMVADIVERELGKGVEVAGAEWRTRAEKIAKKPGSGH